MNKPNYELLKDAYAIMNGIPADIIDLDQIVKSHSGDLKCGTIACAFGWLGMHPVFKKLMGPTSRIAPDWTIRGTAYSWYVDAAAALFVIAYGDARSLFCAAGDSRYDHYHGGFNHKAMFLYRLESFLKEHGQWNGLTDCKGPVSC